MKMIKRIPLFSLSTLLFALFFSAIPLVAIASIQDPVRIDKSRIPREGMSAKDFVPRGWKVEEEIAGDLNGDSLPDLALKLVEDKPAKDKDGDATERQRALVIALRGNAGKLTRAAVADKLLQCTRCGGAFYGVVEAPAEVTIEKGVLVVNQEHGSRDLTNTTYRFRYESDTGKFALIGFDLVDADRLTATVVSESTNYRTGVRIVTRDKGKSRNSRTAIAKKKFYLDDVDGEAFEAAAYKRLGL
jgi:hypothetical protein